MRVVPPILVASAAALVVAGCGGPPNYSLDGTRACLRKAGARITNPASDFVAQSATAGTFRAWLHGRRGNFVTISFGETQTDAKHTADGYERFHARNVGLSDILQIQRNAVLLWREHPSDADVGEVTKCLR